MNELVLEETERKSKLRSSTRHKNPKVNEVDVSQIGEGAVQPATADRKLKHTEAGSRTKVPDKSNLREKSTRNGFLECQLAFLWRSPNILERKIKRLLEKISECKRTQEHNPF